MNPNYYLKNIRLENGFKYDNDEIIGTNTELFDIEIENDTIKSIIPHDPKTNGIDCEGQLMLPTFKDMHTHLDKMLYGLPWQAVSEKRKTVKDMIAYEQKMIPEWLETSIERSTKMIDLLQGFGTDFARSHFNIDPTSGLKSLENLEIVLQNKQKTFNSELVAFPQHGIFYTNTLPLLREVASLPEVNYIGGVDPYTIDGSIEKPIDEIIQLAIDHNKGIDIHLHELGEIGIKTINYIIEKVIENPQLQHKSFISHAYVLSTLPIKDVEAIAEKLSQANVGIVSAVPIGKLMMPIPILKNKNVNVQIGTDNIQDHWSTFGIGNMLQKAQQIAELYDYKTEYQLSRALGFATNNVLPLTNDGKLNWPKVGDEASFLFFNSTCSAETVSRITPVQKFVHKGEIVF
jgi:cytosine/adenosine deaminase-related metal-dependent hydrolase